MPQHIQADIAIIGAMDEEVTALITYLANLKKHQTLKFIYYSGQLHSKEIVVFQSGLGKVNAALAAAFVIEQCSPQCIINIGSAGGLDKQLTIGDVVISSEAFYHDVDVTLLNFEYGQIPDMPKAFPADKNLIAIAKQAITATGLNAVEGAIGSGDTFIADPNHIALIQQRFEHMIAVDMEAAAIAHTCYLYNTPFVVIRAISDVVGNNDNHVDFCTFLKTASVNSAKVVENMIASL